MRCRAAEKLAVALGTSADLPSRLGSAMMHALAEAAASNGHTYMSWQALQKQSLKLLRDSGMPYATKTRLHPFSRQSFCCRHYHCCCLSCHLFHAVPFLVTLLTTLPSTCVDWSSLMWLGHACTHSQVDQAVCCIV